MNTSNTDFHQSKFPASFFHSHAPDAIAKRLSCKRHYSYLRDFVYGAVDGTVTTFAVVSGVIGAQLESKTILILGVANLLADGFSMAASNYLGTRTEQDERNLLRQFELSQIEVDGEGEREEVYQILNSKGLEGDILNQATQAITKNRQHWVDLMLAEEYGMGNMLRSPLRAGISTFAAFIICGVSPLIPFILKMQEAFDYACLLTAIVFFSVGSLKSHWTTQSFIKSGVETLSVGIGAAALAYFIGCTLKSMTNN